jgi:hypothetical protein
MDPRLGRGGIAAAIVGIVATATLVGPAVTVSAHSSKHAKGPVAPSAFKVSVFAKATAAFSNPDSVEVFGNNVFVGYQNVTSKTGSDGRSSTVVEYSLSGKLRRTFSVLGHVDGVRMNPSTGLLWVLSNEDANPKLTIIDPASGNFTQYAVPPVNAGSDPNNFGGYDDIAFTGGKIFFSASNPFNNPNTDPAVVSVTISGSSVITTPVLLGNATATNVVGGGTVTLNLQDPDSLYVLPNGDLQLDSQADSELVFIHNPGTGGQTVSVLSVGNQMDDTIFPTSASGTLLVADTSGGAVYAFKSKHFDTTRYLSAAPSDSSVAGYVGLISPTTGSNTPIFTGMVSPHGEAFIPSSSH